MDDPEEDWEMKPK